jgi:apolipoprotein N-acyltransferase
MRALEFQRPMVRATNTGATVVIDHRGRVTDALPRLTRGVLVAGVEGRSDSVTPYGRWVSRAGLWPLWIGALLVIGLTVLLQRRRP